MRRVRDECPPGVVELRQLAAHALEGTGELRELVASGILHGLPEVAPRDALGGALEPPDAPCERRRGAVAEQRDDDEGEQTGEQQPPLDELDVPQCVVERGGEKDDVAAGKRPRDLGERPIRALHPALRARAADERAQGDGIPLDVGRALRQAGVAEHLQRRRIVGEHPIEHDTGVRRLGGVLELVVEQRRGRVQLGRDRGQ